MAFSSLSLKGRALRHLARREHSRAELERKLAPYAETVPGTSAAEQIGAALDELAAHGLLSDERTAESVLAGAGRRLGGRRLAQSLAAKGLAPELVAATLAQARGSEFERALAVWQRRFGAPPASLAERARQARFLAGRGFDGDVIRRVLRQAGAVQSDDEAQ
ncbi:MAG: recombination regulator RecX [Rubrivivax sp.]